MRFQRKTGALRNICLVWGVLGVAGWAAAQAREAKSGYHWPATVSFYEPLTYLIVLLAGAGWVSLLWPFRLDVGADGLTVLARGSTTVLPWASIESITVIKIGDGWGNPPLRIRLAPGVRLGGRWATRKNGRRVYTLLDMDDFTVPPEEVLAVLQRYGGSRIYAEDYLRHRHGKRMVAAWLADRSVFDRDRPPGSDEGDR
ncbi:hypothetical protein OG559_16225 [Micromonospora sp. NBC_01405]|uniref:hypothetical protein n=1 Tax=Micromonospora sp. NBC_01405 TaxID=2903589 RepID=UPI003253E175